MLMLSSSHCHKYTFSLPVVQKYLDPHCGFIISYAQILVMVESVAAKYKNDGLKGNILVCVCVVPKSWFVKEDSIKTRAHTGNFGERVKIAFSSLMVVV